MTAVMWTYSQVVWAYFILDAATLATSKYVEMPPKNSAYPIKKEEFRIHVEDIHTKMNNTSKNITAKADSLQPLGLFIAKPSKEITAKADSFKPLSLFIAKPSNIQDLLRHTNDQAQAYSNTQPRYAENFGMMATSSEQQYRGINPKLSLFSKVDKKKKSNKLPEPKGSDRYLTPELYKFKTDIEKETVRTHIRGLKMSPDAAAAPTIIHDRPYPKFETPRYNYNRRPGSLSREETFINPYVYDEPYAYEESPSTPYAKPVSYSQYTSIPSRDTHYPSSTGNSYYEPPSDYSFPYYPTVEPEPYYYPKPAEPDSYNKYSSDPSYDFPVDYPPSPPIPSINYHDTEGYFPSAKNRETAGDKEEPEDGSSANDEDDFDKDIPASDPAPKTPKKSHRNPNYEVSEYGADPGETDVKFSRNSPKKNRPRAKPRRPQAPPKEDEDEEFDSNYEPPDGFQEDKDENLDAEDSTEDEPPIPKAKLQLPSKKLIKRVRGRPSRSRNKRCVKKRKEMSVETEMASGGFDEEPSKKMTCLICENLDTGGTYETCSYESDPKKNSYYEGNEASYRKGNTKNPYKYRMRRQTVTIINSTSSPSKRIVRRSYNSDSMGAFTSDIEDFSNDDFNDDDHEDQQEDDDDEFEEYKPTKPAYANEDACTEVSKDGLTCMVCHNPETNGKYKQCSYANDPDKNNYEYAQSSSYGSKDVPYKERHRRQPNKKANKKANSDGMQIQGTIPKEIKVPSDWKLLRTIEQNKIGAINKNFQKLLHSKEEPDSETLASIGNPSYEEQFLSLFPELNNDQSGESLLGEQSLLKELNEKPSFAGKSDLSVFNKKNKIGGYFKNKQKSILDDDDEDTEMSKMMKEFKTKDRSACKKSIKDKMTCYVCDDKDGIKREECMYVVENEPTKVSYHESSKTKPEESVAKSSQKREVYYKSPLKVFKYKYVPAFELKDQPGIGSSIHKTISDKPSQKYSYTPSHKPKGYSNVKIHTEKTYSLKTLPTKVGKRDLVGAHTIQEQLTQGSNKKQVYRKRKPKPSEDEEEDESPDPEETGEHAAVEVVPEVDPESPDGLFSDETKDIYSPEYKETLPRYMVEKHDLEKIVDSFIDRMK